ncbi:MAG: NusG domain II-containing protein [Clostridiales bacterium]|nr:NusG domain II-containing protein [Clostridiales bacterium]
MKRGDYKIIIIILALVLGAYGYVFYKGMSTNDKILTITQDQEVLYEFKIDESYSNMIRIENDDQYNVIYIQDGEVWVEEANCLNQVCVTHSHVSKIGEMIVCIPHKLILEIKGDKNVLDIIVD